MSGLDDDDDDPDDGPAPAVSPPIAEEDEDDIYDDTFESEAPSDADTAIARHEPVVSKRAAALAALAAPAEDDDEDDEDENIMTIEDAHMRGLLTASEYQLRLSKLDENPDLAFYRSV